MVGLLGSERRGLTRREFLMAAAALPAIGGVAALPAFADEPRHFPPYLGLEKFIAPGTDEFPEERTAAAIADALNTALSSRELPSADAGIQRIWKSWIASLGEIRRAQFFVLPDGIVRYEAAGSRDGQLQYRTGTWKQTWTDGRILEFVPVEEHVASAAEPYFRDVTGAAFSGVESFDRQLAFGIPYWRARLDPATGIDVYGSNGIAVGDIDGDGRDEIYVCQPGGLPNRLYKFVDGAMSDITEEWGVGILDDTSSALFVDLRNSGRQDLVVLRSNGPILFVNRGTRFQLRTDAFRFATAPAGGFTGMAAGDFDRDGKLDLYLCCYVYFQSEAQYTYASPYHDARNGPPNFLFRNRLEKDGSGFLDDCTAETGMNENNDRFTFAAAWCDFNGDGWPDLYVANDFGRKNLYVNHQGNFRDLAAAAGVEDIGPGMSAQWFDYDGDGQPDLYVANMWTASGQRVIRDPAFAPAREAAVRDAYARHTMGNSLFRNRGDGTFEDVTLRERAGFGRWAWASGGHDLDNDGDAEIFITCGMLTNGSTTDLSSFFWRQVVARSPVKAMPSAVYENGWNALNQFVREEYSWNGHEPNVLHKRSGDRYFDVSGVSGLDFADDSRAFAILDFDGDGRPDVILKSRLGPQVRVLQNRCASANHSIAFELQGTRSNRDAIGARVEVDGQTKWLDCGSGFLSQHSKCMLFGLGASAAATRVRVTWPSGTVQEFNELAAGRTYSIVEGQARVDAKRFLPPRQLPSQPVEAHNEQELHDTWFLEPLPFPEPQRGPGLLILSSGEPIPTAYGAGAKVIDFSKETADRRRQYEVFRRYLFDWRTGLATPLAFLLNASGQAVKVYAHLPAASQYEADLAQAPPSLLPFSGFYVKPPRRDFFKFGAAFLWSGYPEQALPYLEQVLRQTPDNARVLVLVGQIHLLAGRVDAAEKSFRQAAGRNADYAEAWSGLADVCDARNDSPEALKLYQRAYALKPDLFYNLLNAGLAAAKLDRQEDAETWFRRALQADPLSPEAANGLGLALVKRGRAEDARPLFEQAIAERRDYSAAINNLGALYLQQAKVDDAIAAFEYGIRVAPDEDILYLNLGRTYARLGKFDKARQVMQQLLDRKPGNATATRALQELAER